MLSHKTKTAGKKPVDSATIKTEVVCPNDANPMGLLQGGRMLQWMDIAAAVCAQNHAGKICVTASIDNVTFKSSAHIGDVIIIRAVVTRAFNTSMEIFVTAIARNVITQEQHLVNEAFFTFVAIDSHAKPASVPPLIPHSKGEKELFVSALSRRKKLKAR
jgi:acyl-CoA hydrolase